MAAFAGFPASRNRSVPVPETFFTSLLPEIDDWFELKVTVHLFEVLYHKQGQPRCVSDRELATDTKLQRSLRRRGDPRSFEDRIQHGLNLAVRRGSLLRVRVRIDTEVVSWLFFNTDRNRRIVQRLLQGEMSPLVLLEAEGISSETTILSIEGEQPDIYSLYEQNIGLLVPMVSEQLTDAASRYPEEWIQEAIKEAIEHNKRNWSYVKAILQRWEYEGKGGKHYEGGSRRTPFTAR